MKAILSVFLAAIFLAANLQLRIGTHYCGGEAVKSEIVSGHSELTCGMTKEDNSCETKITKGLDAFSEKECCQNDFSSLQIEEEFNSKIQLERIIQKSIELTEKIDLSLFTFSTNSYSFKPDRPPPLISQDFQVLFQIFLI